MCAIYFRRKILTKWLIEIFDPNLKFFLEHCVKYLFQFAPFMRKLQPTILTQYLVYFNI